MWHVSSHSGVATLRTAIHLLLTVKQSVLLVGSRVCVCVCVCACVCYIPVLLRQDVAAVGLRHSIEARRCGHRVCAHVTEDDPVADVHIGQPTLVQNAVEAVARWTPDAACILRLTDQRLRLTTHTSVSRPFVQDYPGQPVPERLNQPGFY